MAEIKRKALSAEELYAFSDEMAMMLESGVSSIQGITMMLDEAKDKEEEILLSEMEETISMTGSLAKAIEDVAVFPDYFVEMARMGEQTGKMDVVLRNLSSHYVREISIGSAIRSAVTYPLMMVVMMLVIIIVLVTEIMPIFQRVFKQLGGTMNGISAGFLTVGSFLHSYGWIFLVVLMVAVIYLIITVRTKNGRDRIIKLAYNKKNMGRIYGKIATSRFASAMAMTLSSGMDIMQALDIAGGIVAVPDFDKKIEKCKDSFVENMDIGKAFSDSGIFGGLYGRMAILGAKTGNMESVLEKVANTYQEEADQEINDLIAVVEPALVIILSVVVGLILLSVMLPLLSIMSGML